MEGGLLEANILHQSHERPQHAVGRGGHSRNRSDDFDVVPPGR